MAKILKIPTYKCAECFDGYACEVSADKAHLHFTHPGKLKKDSLCLKEFNKPIIDFTEIWDA